jgi:hypothetical protein
MLTGCSFDGAQSNYHIGSWTFNSSSLDMRSRCPLTIEAHARKYFCGEQLEHTARVHAESLRVGRFEPVLCRLPERGVDVRRLFDALDGRRKAGRSGRILFAGDSLMDQMRVALLCEAEAQGLLDEAQMRVDWQWQSWLVRADASALLQAHTVANEHWLANVDLKGVSVLVLNTGAWWNSAKLGHNIYASTIRRALNAIVALLHAKEFQPIVVWRDISPVGNGSGADVADARFNWHQFSAWNAIGREVFERAGHHVLRIEEASAQRSADAHLGCRRADASAGAPICDWMHWCSPAPAGVPLMWLELLSNMILHEPTFWTKATTLARHRDNARGALVNVDDSGVERSAHARE